MIAYKTYYSFQVLKRVLKHMSHIITDDFRTKQEQFQEFQNQFRKVLGFSCY
jgi:hypothetical protein